MQASSSRVVAPSPIPLTSASLSSSLSTGKRPKLAKKSQSSVVKQRGVQASLEAQVEKCRGWQAYFLPVKPMPSVPPSSPVLAARVIEMDGHLDMDMDMDMEGSGDISDLSRTTSNSSHHLQQQCAMGLPMGFGTEAMQLYGRGEERQDPAGPTQKKADAKGISYEGQLKRREEWACWIGSDGHGSELRHGGD
jgi:hypothetical protein